MGNSGFTNLTGLAPIAAAIGSDSIGPPFDMVAITASFGGLEAVSDLLSALPGDFSAPVVLVQHLAQRFPSAYPDVLSRRGPLQVKWAAQGERPQPATVYVAPVGAHLVIDANLRFSLWRGPRIQFVRPSADISFGSMAAVFRHRLIAVVMTGYGRDGAFGVNLVKSMGGRVLVQDPFTAAAPGMPEAAARTGCADFILPLSKISPALVALTMAPGAADLFAVGGPAEFSN